MAATHPSPPAAVRSEPAHFTNCQPRVGLAIHPRMPPELAHAAAAAADGKPWPVAAVPAPPTDRMTLYARARSRIRRGLLPDDTWSRHHAAARLLGSPVSILDSGGVPGVLALFLPETLVVTANVEPPADVLFDGHRLPFPDSSFRAVTSLDVLEHIPPAARADHFAELSRVAATTVVVSFPLGTDEHREAEQSLARWYADVTGTRHRFLEEHLSNGLPTESEMHRLAEEAGLRCEFVYQGDFRRTNDLFRLSVQARHERRPDLALRYAAIRMAPVRDDDLRNEPTPWTNRAFVVARLTG